MGAFAQELNHPIENKEVTNRSLGIRLAPIHKYRGRNRRFLIILVESPSIVNEVATPAGRTLENISVRISYFANLSHGYSGSSNDGKTEFLINKFFIGKSLNPFGGSLPSNISLQNSSFSDNSDR